MYKKALQLNLRLATPKGLLSIEQAMTLSLTDLEASVKKVNETLKEYSKEDDSLSFLEKDSSVPEEVQLAFDILKDIYLDKKAKKDEAKDAAAIKAHNQKILSIIAEQEEKELKNKTPEELRKLLK